MTVYQNVIIDSIFLIFSNFSYDDLMSKTGYPTREMIKNCYIRSYDEFIPTGKSKWLNLERYKGYMRWSKRAFIALQHAKGKKPYDIVREDLHFEHITPNALILDRLMEKKRLSPNSPISKNVIASILNESEIVVLSKEESTILDGSVNKKYPLGDDEMNGLNMKSKQDGTIRLNAIGATLKPFKEWEYEHIDS